MMLNVWLLLLLCYMLLLRMVQLCKMLLLLLLLWIDLLLVVILKRGITVLIHRFLMRSWLTVDRQLSHDELIPGAFCVIAHVLIGHPMLCFRVLLAGLVPVIHYVL